MGIRFDNTGVYKCSNTGVIRETGVIIPLSGLGGTRMTGKHKLNRPVHVKQRCDDTGIQHYCSNYDTGNRIQICEITQINKPNTYIL